jgi:hypothetical protein
VYFQEVELDVRQKDGALASSMISGSILNQKKIGVYVQVLVVSSKNLQKKEVTSIFCCVFASDCIIMYDQKYLLGPISEPVRTIINDFSVIRV